MMQSKFGQTFSQSGLCMGLGIVSMLGGILGATSSCNRGGSALADAGPVGVVDALPPGPPPDLAGPGTPSGTHLVDVLFVVDNSPSMSPKQKVLAKNIQPFLSGLDAAGLDYHIAFVSTDVGSTVAPGTPWGGNLGSCDTYEGDDGVLQAAACDSRTGGTSDARNDCSALCPDDQYVPQDGKRYISKFGGVTNVPVHMVVDPMTGKMVDEGPLRAFQCLALLGDSGCGIEAPLESARRALDGHRAENSGFLHPGSLLAVIFLTDEDDCSVQLARRAENNPATHDCATPDNNASYDCYNVDYRCLASSIVCDQPMNTPGLKTHCTERPASYLEPISSYATFFNRLRPPERLLLGGIWTLPAIDQGGKVSITAGGGGTGGGSPFLNRAGGAGAACSYSGDASITGQAQRRLSSFAASFPDSPQYSICDFDSLATKLAQLGQAIVAKAQK